jgi:hypothetical protein
MHLEDWKIIIKNYILWHIQSIEYQVQEETKGARIIKQLRQHSLPAQIAAPQLNTIQFVRSVDTTGANR